MSPNADPAPSVALAPFRIDVPESDLEDLRQRLRKARWPDQVPGTGWEYGADVATIRQLA